MMSTQHGSHIWYELLTGDVDGASAFYRKVLPWTVAPAGMPDIDYRIATAADGGQVAGIMALTPQMGERGPGWMGYIGVDDVDAAAARIAAAGGSVLMPPADIPEVGRFAMVTDPQGIAFYIMRGASDAMSTAFAYDKPRPGHGAWNELATPDKDGAAAFYADIFGLAKDGEMDMGAAGTYDFMRDGEGLLGAIMRQPPEMPAPGWSYYFRVPDLDAAKTAVEANGGKVLHGPHEVPGGDFIINAVDPQGALFSLVGGRTD